VEAFFSGLKRTMGSTLTSRKPSQLLAEAAFKVLGLHPPALAESMQSRMYSTEQFKLKAIFKFMAKIIAIQILHKRLVQRDRRTNRPHHVYAALKRNLQLSQSQMGNGIPPLRTKAARFAAVKPYFWPLHPVATPSN
jgi:hypothetical protein